jgi:hypothetical protein
MIEENMTAEKNKVDSQRRDKSLYGPTQMSNDLPLFKERSCLDARYFTVGVKHQQDINWKVSTDKTSEAFKVVEEFIQKVSTHGGDTELLLELRLLKGNTQLNATVYLALSQLLQAGTEGSKARWSLRVY